MIELEVGKSYRLRNGDVVRINEKTWFTKFPFLSSDSALRFDKNGRSRIDKEPWKYDIVEEVSKLKLEVGKSYRDRHGRVVKIIRNDGTPKMPFQGDNDIWYSPDGHFITQGGEYDLIEEVDSLSESKAAFERAVDEYEAKTQIDRKKLAGWFRKIADALESDQYSEFIFHQGELTIDQRETYPGSDSCSTEVSIDMSFDLAP